MTAHNAHGLSRRNLKHAAETTNALPVPSRAAEVSDGENALAVRVLLRLAMRQGYEPDEFNEAVSEACAMLGLSMEQARKFDLETFREERATAVAIAVASHTKPVSAS